jgi:hypothetical protein
VDDVFVSERASVDDSEPRAGGEYAHQLGAGKPRLVGNLERVYRLGVTPKSAQAQPALPE